MRSGAAMFTGIRKFGDKVGDKFGETLRKGRTSEFAPEVEEEKRVFGNALKRNHDDIPVILRKVVEFFDEKGVEIEGLFRISGAQSQMLALKEQFERGEDVDLSGADPHCCASLLKQYFRELPEPLCTYELYDCFLAAASCPDEVAIPKITTVLKMLPMGHRVTIKYLARFLRDVCAASDINKMTPSNVAIVFAPNLLKPPGNDVMAQIDDTPYSNKLMQMFVINYDTLFADEPDPGHMSKIKRRSRRHSIGSASASAEQEQPFIQQHAAGPTKSSGPEATRKEPLPPRLARSQDDTSVGRMRLAPGEAHGMPRGRGRGRGWAHNPRGRGRGRGAPRGRGEPSPRGAWWGDRGRGGSAARGGPAGRPVNGEAHPSGPNSAPSAAGVHNERLRSRTVATTPPASERRPPPQRPPSANSIAEITPRRAVGRRAVISDGPEGSAGAGGGPNARGRTGGGAASAVGAAASEDGTDAARPAPPPRRKRMAGMWSNIKITDEEIVGGPELPARRRACTLPVNQSPPLARPKKVSSEIHQ